MTKIALTGNIASGKSHIAEIFRGLGAVTIDADKIAHDILENAAKEKIQELFGTTSRAELGKIVFGNAAKLSQLEDILHPLVRKKYLEFLNENEGKIAIVEIPLLFETGAEEFFDKIIFVDVNEEAQKNRALLRPGWNKEKLAHALKRQQKIPPSEKRKNADFVIDNNDSADTVAQVKIIMEKLCAK